jgi:hypothetical protein
MSTPTSMTRVPASARPALKERLGDLRHDLGKYMVFQLRWLPPEPSDADLREALDADLNRTRSGGGRVESAPAIWARLRPGLVGLEALGDGSTVDLGADPDLLAIDSAIDAITGILPRLARAQRPELEAARLAALDAAGATGRLLKRARAL